MCVDLLHLPEVVLIDQRPSQARPDQEWDQAATEVEGGRGKEAVLVMESRSLLCPI